MFIRFEVSWIPLCYFYVDVCMYVCVCVCVWVNTISSKLCIRLSSNLLCRLQITVGRTLLILMIVGCLIFFFCSSFFRCSYTIRPVDTNSLKCSSISIVHSIVLKFGMYILGHRRTNSTDFGEIRIITFFGST